MMYGYGFNAGLPLFFGIHVIAMTILVIGIALFIGWAIRYLPAGQLKSWAWWMVGIGVVLCIITLPLLGYAHVAGGNIGYGMMNWNGNGYADNGFPAMMRGFSYSASENGSASSESEDADVQKGQALYNQLQAKQITCSDLTNDDFDVIGDYAMNQHLGEAHDQMDNVMENMMGAEGNEQMHILLGRRITNCYGNAASASSAQSSR